MGILQSIHGTRLNSPPTQFVDISILDDPTSLAITVDNPTDQAVRGTDVFAPDTTLREAMDYVDQNPTARTVINLTVDTRLHRQIRTENVGKFTLTSTSGQSICGGNIRVEDYNQAIFRNVRFYNDVSQMIGSSSNNDCLTLWNNTYGGESLIENCCFAFGQDEMAGIYNSAKTVIRNNFFAYGQRVSTAGPETGKGVLIYGDGGYATVAIYNNIWHAIYYRPQISNARVLYAGNWSQFYNAHQIFLSNSNGDTDGDILDNVYTYGYAPFNNAQNLRVHNTQCKYFIDGNTQSGTATPWGVTSSTSVSAEPSQINVWPTVWRKTANDLVAVTAEVGTSSHDAIEQQITQDLTDTEIYSTTPLAIPEVAAQIRWDSTNCAVIGCDPDIFVWGNRSVSGNELRLRIESINDFVGTPLAAPHDWDIQVLDGLGVLRWTGHGQIGEQLNNNTVSSNGLTLLSGQLTPGTDLAWNLTEADAIQAATGALRVRAVSRTPTNGGCASNSYAEIRP